MTHDEMIAVIQAHKDGKKIEYSWGSLVEWHTSNADKFNFERYVYRVAPEPPKPREWRVRVSADGNIYSDWTEVMGPEIYVREVIE